VRVDVKLLCEGLDGVEGQVALAALDACQVASRDLKPLSEGFLRQAATKTLGTHVRAER